MNDQTVIDIGTRALWITMQIAAPALGATLVVGIIISIFQAATQINEQTLSFVPKVLAITAILVFTGPWILQLMMGFTREILNGIPQVTH